MMQRYEFKTPHKWYKLVMKKIQFSYLINVVLSAAVLFAWQPATALDLDQYPRLKKSVAPLIKKGVYTEKELKDIFSTVVLREEVIKKKANAAEKVLTWGRGGRRGTGYRGIFIKTQRINQGAQFWRENQVLMDQAKTELGLDGSMISAIIGVETKFGQNKGSHLVLDAIASHIVNRNSKLQFGQLPIFLSLVKKGDLPLNSKGSYSAAIGIPQFISSSYRDYGIDFDDDGKVDLVSSTADAIGSVANYFKRHQWRSNEPVMAQVQPKNKQAAQQLDQMAVTKINSRVKPKTTLSAVTPLLKSLPEAVKPDARLSIFKFMDENDQPEYFLGYHNFYVIMRYNHSALYARAVHELSQQISQAY